ncbi:MAG: sodium/pantothenate symporter [Firmicutes bacterium]|nr:sodium/pantothenate symporter [Bacillota bacterium]
MHNIPVIIPIIVYLLLMLVIAAYTSRLGRKKGGGFLEEYFIGSRSLGAFVLAMTIIATFVSASSFIGGPGVAYSTGLAWVLLSMIQVPTAFLTLGVLGKKFAIIARRIKAVTVTDYLYARYQSKAVVFVASLAILAFFTAMMVAQFIGGGVLFQNMTGYSYLTGLILFGLIVIIYTTVGGFRAVVFTDAIQAVVMVVATVTITCAIIKAGGGVESIVDRIAAANPSMLDANAVPKPQILSFWVLVGIGLLGLPQTTVRAMSFKDTKALHNSIIIGTVVVGFLMLGMHLAGFFSAGVLAGTPETSDSVIPMIVMQVLPSFWAGIFLAGPLAAIMSTVSSLLILASAAIIKDMLLRFGKKQYDNRQLKKISILCTAVIGVITFLCAVKPPDLIVWINLFAMGGLEAAFFWPTVLGLFWRRANASGAICSAIGGVATFLILGGLGFSFHGMNNIIFGLAVGLVFFIIGTYLGPKPSDRVNEMFFE